MRFLLAALAACISLPACSNHPIVDNVTGYSTSDVVNKVRCEILTELLHFLSAGRLESFRQQFDDFEVDKKAIKYASKSVLELKEIADRIIAQSNDILSKFRSRSKRQLIIRKDSDKLDRQIEELIKVIRLAIVEAGNADDRVALIRLQTRFAGFEREVKRLESESERLVARQKEFDGEEALLNEQMGALIAEAREFEKDKNFKAYQKYKKAADEVAKAKEKLAEFGSDLSKYYAFATTNVAMQFRFQITENDNGSGAGSIVWPVALGNITLGFSSGKNKSRLSERTVGVSEDFSDLLHIGTNCRNLDFVSETQSPRARVYPVTGNIGMGELINQFLWINRDVKLTKRDYSKDKKTFYEKLQFTTTLKGGLKPSLVLNPNKGHTVRFDGDFNADRADLHEVIVDILPGVEPADAAPEPKDPETKFNLVKVPNLSIRLVSEGEWQTSTIVVPTSRGMSKQ